MDWCGATAEQLLEGAGCRAIARVCEVSPIKSAESILLQEVDGHLRELIFGQGRWIVLSH